MLDDDDIIVALACALEAKCLSVVELSAWVEERFAMLNQPPDWLIDLWSTPDADRASRFWRIVEQRASQDESFRRLYARFGQLELGFVFLHHERGDFGLADLLERAGDLSDCKDCGIDCSAFYSLLNELNDGESDLSSDLALSERVIATFQPFVRLARSHFSLLPKK